MANFSAADISEPFGRLFLPPLPFPFPSAVSPSGADNGFISAAACRWKVPRGERRHTEAEPSAGADRDGLGEWVRRLISHMHN